ncbi:hypothetical protein BJY59DRAFT_702864, partial [Rhodotorula toruloides]
MPCHGVSRYPSSVSFSELSSSSVCSRRSHSFTSLRFSLASPPCSAHTLLLSASARYTHQRVATPPPSSSPRTHAPPPPPPPLIARMTTPSRASLAAALLSHDEGDGKRGGGVGVGGSAVLQPWRHLLHAEEPSVRVGDAEGEERGGAFEGVGMREDEEGAMRSFGLSTDEQGARSTPSFDLEREMSFRTSSLDFNSLPPHPRLDLSTEEEERLADEWGLSEVMSNVGSEDALRVELAGGAALARFPSTTRSEAGILTTVQRAPQKDAEQEEDVEVLETKSMPDLDRPRTISFADAVLEGLEQRLRNAPPPRASSTTSGDETSSTGTRVKILERTATQRMRARTTSLGPHAGMASLPSLSNLAGDGSVGDISSGRGGIATRDSLFQRPTSVYTTRASSIDALNPTSAAARPSIDALSLVPSRLSFALPSDPPSAAPDPPRPSTSLSTYTSRFDPLVIAAHRAQLAKDRPKFSNEEAGRPPRVVVMPAPLAGRARSPPGRKGWREGPDSGSESDDAEAEEEQEEEEEEVPEGLKDPLHPAGALYGRSLMDVIAERKAILKAQQRAYVPGSDGRKSMFEWKDGPVTGRQEEEVENVPLALVPGGQAALAAAAAKNQARATKVKSIFGPDLVYQRELAQMRELEEAERAEREERERVEEERRLREEARRRKGKLRKGGRGKKGEQAVREAAPRVQDAVEWQPETDVAEEEPVEVAAPADAPVMRHVPPVEPPASRQIVAPSISVPFDVSQAASPSDWFEEVLADPSATKETGDAASDEDDEDLYKPRPVSSLASYRRSSRAAAFNTRRNTFLPSDSSSSDADSDDLENFASPVDPVPSGANGDQRHLPFPGEPSSNGHDSVSQAETQDDVPLGVRYSRQAMALPQIQSTGLEDLSHLIPQEEHRAGAEEAEDEDDAPLGARFSRAMPPTDDGDDIPLVLRRIALAPSAAFAPRPPPQPFASIRPIGDDGKTVASDDSDDLPLGLKTAPTAPFAHQPAPYSFPPTMPYGASGAPFPYSTSQLSPPPLAPTFAPAIALPLPPNPHAQLALAQMQMQAAMQQQAVLAEGGLIERWRREISG